MTYEEAMQKSINVKWFIKTCDVGEKCWCRMICTEEEIKDENGEIIYIIGSGAASKEHAEHIVKIHNDSLNKH